MTILKTKRLILRGPTPADLDDLFAFFGDPAVMQYWSTPAHDNIAITNERLTSMMTRFEEAPTYFVIELNQRVIGCAGAHSGSEVGFILHADYWRQGIGFEAMAAIITHLWRCTNHPELTADLDPENHASKALLTRLGFIENGYEKNTYCIDGKWTDSLYMRLPRPV